MKNIALVSNTSWYVYNFRKGLLKKLVAEGYNLFAIAPRDKFVAEIEAIGCTFIELKHINNKGKNPVEDILLTLELRKTLIANDIQCCLFFTPKINIYGSIAIKFTNIKAISTINGLGFVFNEGQPAWLQFTVKKLYRFAFKKLEALFFQNEDDKAFFLNANLINGRQSISVVRGSGVNINEFSNKVSFNNSDKLVFLLSARLLKEKGLYEYFEAAKELKKKFTSVTFALLGPLADNPSAVSLDIINGFHKQGTIDYWGVSDNMSDTLNKVDIMVLPSYYREGVPRVLIEGLSKGLPIITTDNVGCRETVDDLQNGYLIPIKDTKSLASAIEKMISIPPEDRLAMGKHSRQKAITEFDEALNHQRYLEVIKKLMPDN
ncbi:glycosyltransferase family 4 protein [soil metagenome]